MPIYDLVCPQGHELLDVYLKLGERPPCKTCGEPTSTLWRNSSKVISDECDIWIKHGICNDDGTPRRYTSKSEMREEAKRRGLSNHVEHVTDPRAGTDKSKHTQRWI